MILVRIAVLLARLDVRHKFGQIFQIGIAHGGVSFLFAFGDTP